MWRALVRHIAAVRRRLARGLADLRYAQRRVTVLAAAPDRWIPDPHAGPATYAEFLFRTSGPSLREPSAALRAAGQLVGLPHRPDRAQGPVGPAAGEQAGRRGQV